MRLGLGGAALVGLTGRRNLAILKAAARRIEAEASPRQCRDLWAVLRMLSEGRYTARKLERAVPKEVVMGSSLFAEVRRRSREEGRAEGELAGIRTDCVALVSQHHPGILSAVRSSIEACPDPRVLRDWLLAAPRVSDAEFVRLVHSASSGTAHGTTPGSSRVRAPRPSRRDRRR